MHEQSDRARLARRYRRLLLTYPRSYRRRHGAEIVTTLLDAAPPGRLRPSRVEAVDLLTGGIRFRFRVWGTAGLLAAIAAATFAAVSLGAFGSYLGWQTAPRLPSDAEVLRMLQPALPPGASAQPQRWDFIFDDNPQYTDPRWIYLVGGTDDYQAGKVFFQFAYPNEKRPQQVVAGVDEGMRTAGWQPVAKQMSGCCPETALHRDGWLVEAFSEGYLDESHYGLQIAVSRTTPAAVLPLTTAGLLAGGLAGWLIAAWVFRRIRGFSATRRAVTGLVFGAGLLAILPATALSALALIASYLAPDHPAAPAWLGYTFILFRPLAYLGAAAVVGCLPIVALSDQARRGPLTN